jgi:hypothetical protein
VNPKLKAFFKQHPLPWRHVKEKARFAYHTEDANGGRPMKKFDYPSELRNLLHEYSIELLNAEAAKAKKGKRNAT